MRILFVKLGAIGDVIQSATAILEFRTQHPGVTIDWVVGNPVLPLIQATGVADRLIGIDDAALVSGSTISRTFALLRIAQTIRRTCRGQYDGIYTAYVDSRYKLLTIGVRAKHHKSLGGGKGRPNIIHHRSRVHEYWRLLSNKDSESFDIAAATQSLGSRLALSAPHSAAVAALGPYVVIAAGGAKNLHREDSLRRWPISSYRELITDLIANEQKVVLVGSKTDAWVSEALADLATTDLIGKTTLMELFSVMQHADAIVSNDSGTLHLAALTRTGLVGLFGPTPENAFIPLGRPRTVALAPGNRVSCSPCYDGRHYAPCTRNVCLESISTQTVANAIRRVRGESRQPCNEPGIC